MKQKVKITVNMIATMNMRKRSRGRMGKEIKRLKSKVVQGLRFNRNPIT